MSIVDNTWGNIEWIDNPNDSWGPLLLEVGSNLNEIYSDDVYVYAATTSGLSILSILLETKVADADIYGEFVTVCGNSDTVYLGSPTTGVYCLDKDSILTTTGTVLNLNTSLYPLSSTYKPTYNDIRGLSVYNYDLAVVTASGMDVIGMAAGREFKSTTFSTGNITKRFLTSKKEIYYIEELGTTTVLNVHSPYSCDWEKASTTFIPGSSFIIEGTLLLDIYVTENASLAYYNTIFLATSSGVYVYDEGAVAADIYL